MFRAHPPFPGVLLRSGPEHPTGICVTALQSRRFAKNMLGSPAIT